MKSERHVKAVARVLIDVDVNSVWSGDCTFDQIYKQAEDSVRGLLTQRNGEAIAGLPKRVKSIEVVEVRVTETRQ